MVAEFLAEPPPGMPLLDYAIEQEKKSIQFYEYFQNRMSQEFTEINKKYSVKEEAKLNWKLKQIDGMIEEEQRHMSKLSALKSEMEKL